jgi:tight adherence protein B
MSVLLATFFAGKTGALIIAAGVLLAAGGLTGGIVSAIVAERKRTLTDTLTPYTVGQLPTQRAARSQGTQELVESAFLQRAVAAVGEFASRQGILQYVDKKLAQAKILVRPAEALFLYVVVVVAGGLLGLIAGPVWALIVMAIVAIAPWLILDEVARRRVNKFVAEIPDMLQLLSTTLRSGFSLLQGIDTVSRQLPDPVGEEMRHVVTEARLGRNLVEAMQDLADRIGNPDFQWVVSAIGIQREVGGNLAELLDIVAETMNGRARLRQEAKTLTAEGRIGAVIISILPVAIGLFVYATNPSYIDPLFHSAAGELFFYGSIVLAVVGILWLRSLIRIEV